jgi:hypothetical protein
MTGLRSITAAEWQRRFFELPPEVVLGPRYFRHLGERDFSTYLKPPSAWLPYGFRRLAHLRFDPDVRALRLWAFALEEGERLFRARQEGMKVVALMGDYGAMAPLVYGFADVAAFYPDFCYWTPFLTESEVLLRRADRRGLGEDTCFVRAAVGAFTSHAWWPDPDLVVASSGASCDDLAAVAQVAADTGLPVVWAEIPLRKEPAPWLTITRFAADPDLPEGTPQFEAGAVDRLAGRYRRLLDRMADALGRPLDSVRLAASVARARRIRARIARIRHLFATAPRAPLPASEELLVEFAATHFYGDPVECEAVLDGVLELVEERAADEEPLPSPRIVWVTPPPDPLLHVHGEERGARIVGTEYLIASALAPLPEGDPVRAVARSFLAGSLLGSAEARARSVAATVRDSGADGVVISNLFGSSHCGSEAPVLRRRIEEECGVPVLSFDVPNPVPGGLPSQTLNRLDAFVEALRARRRRCAT